MPLKRQIITSAGAAVDSFGGSGKTFVQLLPTTDANGAEVNGGTVFDTESDNDWKFVKTQSQAILENDDEEIWVYTVSSYSNISKIIFGLWSEAADFTGFYFCASNDTSGFVSTNDSVTDVLADVSDGFGFNFINNSLTINCNYHATYSSISLVNDYTAASTTTYIILDLENQQITIGDSSNEETNTFPRAISPTSYYLGMLFDSADVANLYITYLGVEYYS